MQDKKPRIEIFRTEIRGWLTESEAWLLFRLAKQVQKGKCIVELGSFEGRSTACMAEGTRLGNRTTIYSVDHHLGSPEHWPMWGNVSTLAAFSRNMEKFGFTKNEVQAVQLTTQLAADESYPPIGLLFIDAQHELKAVTKDTELWFPKVADGGVIAFHDAVHSDYAGPGLVTTKLLLFSDRVRKPWQMGSITYFTKSCCPVSWFDRAANWLFFGCRTLVYSPLYLWGLVKIPLKIMGRKNNISFN